MTATEGTKTPRNIRVKIDMSDVELGSLVWTPGPHTQEHLRAIKAEGELEDFLAQLRDVITADIAGTARAICLSERERQMRDEVQELIDELTDGLDSTRVKVVDLTEELPSFVGSAFDMLTQIFDIRPRRDEATSAEDEDPSFTVSSRLND